MIEITLSIEQDNITLETVEDGPINFDTDFSISVAQIPSNYGRIDWDGSVLMVS